jgi:flagellar biosynthesis anti-sigma factor FlgM
MKVDDRKSVTDPRLGTTSTVQPGTAPASEPVSGGDQVTVSSAARELARLRAEVGDVSAVDQQKLQGLTAVMARGQYSADLRDVAKKILREMMSDLLA